MNRLIRRSPNRTAGIAVSVIMRGITHPASAVLAGAALLLTAGIAACGAQPARHVPAGAPAVARARTMLANSPYLGALLTSVALTSPERGYGLFGSQAGTRCLALSGHTSDGGARFGPALPITSWNCNAGLPAVTGIAADSAGDVFAYGPMLFTLARGTDRWRRSPQPGAVLAVSAVGQSVWLVLADCRAAGRDGGRCSLRLLESATGGRSWHSSAAQPAGAYLRGTTAGPATMPALGQTWLLRTGPTAAYVSTYPVMNSSGRPDSASLWYTGNSGASWSRRQLPCGIDAMSAELGYAAGGVLTAVCGGEPSAGNELKTAAVSANGGLTWTVHAACIRAGVPTCQDPLFDGYLSQLAVLSAQRAYLIGGRGPLLLTTDGGQRWRPVGTLGDENGGTPQVIFFGQLDGVVVGSSASTGAAELWHTADGGRHWTMVSPHLS
jgi:photosystem II stability/assembly factor-like uncharacterized protein